MNKGQKFDDGKRRYDLLDPTALGLIVDVLTFGAGLYGDYNWRRLKGARKRYTAALMRHLEAWRSGEWTDAKSGLPHLAHLATCAMFLIWLDKRSRPKKQRV